MAPIFCVSKCSVWKIEPLPCEDVWKGYCVIFNETAFDLAETAQHVAGLSDVPDLVHWPFGLVFAPKEDRSAAVLGWLQEILLGIMVEACWNWEFILGHSHTPQKPWFSIGFGHFISRYHSAGVINCDVIPRVRGQLGQGRLHGRRWQRGFHHPLCDSACFLPWCVENVAFFAPLAQERWTDAWDITWRLGGNATGIAGKKRRLCTSFVKMNMGVVWSSWSHLTIRFWTASTASILSSRNMLKCSVFQHVKLVITTLTSNRIRLSTIFKHLLGFPLYLKFQPVLMCFNAFFLVAPKWWFCNVFVIS